MLDIKQESDVEEDEEENTRSTEYDDTEENEGNKRKKRGRPSARKAANAASLINKHTEDGDGYSFGSHFLDGYGNLIKIFFIGTINYHNNQIIIFSIRLPLDNRLIYFCFRWSRTRTAGQCEI